MARPRPAALPLRATPAVHPRRPLVAAMGAVAGVGRARARLLAAQLGVAPDMPQGALHPALATRLAALLGDIADPLALQRASRARLVEIAARRGLRAAMGLPVRGQRTHGGAHTTRRRRRGLPTAPAGRSPARASRKG